MRDIHRSRGWWLAALVIGLIAPIAGCGGGNGDRPGAADRTVVTFWTTEVERDRMATQRALAEEFRAANPTIEIKIVPVREQDVDKKMMAAAAARVLPDVVRVGLEYVKGYARAGILSSESAGNVIRDLGKDTFFAGPLELVRNAKGGYDAVPIDGWAQGIWYRRDWFDEAGLAAPDTWGALLAAAKAFHHPAEGRYGIVLGTASQETYTQQTFEHVALSNGARLFTPEGKIVTPNPRLREAMVFYKKLAAFGPAGSNSVPEARQNYLTGAAAMIFYSPYIVDDIAGMAPGQLPVEGLAGKTGFVSVIHGPHGDKASYGQVVSLGIVNGPRKEAAEKWVEYLMGPGYLRWCFMTPGGKTPVRKDVLSEWETHEVFAAYVPGFAKQLAAGMESLERWGYFPERVLPVVSDIYGKRVVPQALGAFLAGKCDAEQAIERIDSEIRRLEALRR